MAAPLPEHYEAARSRWPAELVAMLDVAAAALAEELDAEQAEHMATRMMMALARYHGGRMFYLPKGEGLQRALRDRAIYRQYAHHRGSILQLASQYKLTEQQIYRIIDQQRSLHVRRIQPELPLV